MKKTFIFLMIVFLFLAGCSGKTVESPAESCIEKEVTYTETETATKQVCEPIDYVMSIIKSEITPIPNEAKREYDVATVTVNLLNSDKKGGEFTVEIECDTSKLGKIKESSTVDLQPGSPERLTMRCDGKNAGIILSVSDPVVIKVPDSTNCKTVSEEIEVEKTKIVCE